MNMNLLSISILLLHLFLFSSTILGEIEVKKVLNPVEHGEGPHWDNEKEVLFYVDITKQRVVRYDPKTQSSNMVNIEGGPVTLVIPERFHSDNFIISRGRDLLKMTWDENSTEPTALKVLASVDPEKPENRFNDGKADCSGRLWAGTMGPENPDIKLHQGSLYSFDKSDSLKPVKQISPVSISNGIAWNKNNTIMYYIDSPTKTIYAYDFDIDNAKLSNKKELFRLDNHKIEGFPDGMTIDENDNLWVALFSGSGVLNINTTDGSLLQKIQFPVSQVTSCAFGGKDLEDLYVTTSKLHLNETQLKDQPLAGALFVIKGLGVRGQKKLNTVIAD